MDGAFEGKCPVMHTGTVKNQAWWPEQVVEFMLEALERGDFYILCPDEETPRWVDEKRIQWTADDLIQNRPALSRWHPDYAAAFEAFVKGT